MKSRMLKEYLIEDLCEFINGYAFKSKDYIEASTSAIEVFRMGYISKSGCFKEAGTAVFVEDDTSTKMKKYHLVKGDIVIAMTDMKANIGILGNTAWISESNRFILNQRVGCLRIKKPLALDARYLYYYTKQESFIQNLRSKANSGVQVNLTTNAITSTGLLLPNLSEQKTIASILSCLDDKIELNNKINANLEAQAKAIFKGWFVDFEPFQDGEFEDSELGPIPKGWRISNLLNIAQYLNGLAMQKYRPADGEQGIPVLKIKELRQGKCDATSEMCSENIGMEYIVNDGDVIFSWSGSLLIDLWCGGKCGLNQHLFKVSSCQYDKWFYYLWTKQHLDIFIAIAAGKATTMGHIKREDLEKSMVIIPDPASYKIANDLISPIIDMIIINRKENQTLSALRDTLLPELMSGEIQID